MRGETEREPQPAMRCPDSITIERIRVGRDDELWSLCADSGWPFCVPTIDGTPRDFDGIRRVLVDSSYHAYDSDRVSVRRVGTGFVLSRWDAPGVELSWLIALRLAGMIERGLDAHHAAVRARHEKVLALFGGLARAFEQALLMQAYGDMREERGICRAYNACATPSVMVVSADGFEVSQRETLRVDRSRIEGGE